MNLKKEFLKITKKQRESLISNGKNLMPILYIIYYIYNNTYNTYNTIVKFFFHWKQRYKEIPKKHKHLYSSYISIIYGTNTRKDLDA